jgi:hypothetical protein
VGLFDWINTSTAAEPAPAARGPLPPDILTRLDAYGRLRSEGFQSDDYALERGFRDLPQHEQERYVDALAEAVLPVGGFAVFGAAKLLTDSMFKPDDHPSYVRILLESLEIRRSARVSQVALSVNEEMLWHKHNPDAEWLEPHIPPSPEEAVISPLAVGEEREVARYTSAPDTNRVFLVRDAENRYAAEVDMPIDRHEDPRRVRKRIAEAENPYAVLVFVGENPLASHWSHPELEPFCHYGRLR